MAKDYFANLPEIDYYKNKQQKAQPLPAAAPPKAPVQDESPNLTKNLEASNDKYRDRTWGEAAGDVGVDLLKGAVDLGTLPYTIGDLATGGALERATGFGQNNIQRTQDITDQWKSAPLRAKEQRIAETEGFLPTLKAYAEDPQAIVSGLARSAPSMLTPIGAGKLGATMAARGLTGKAAQEAAKKGATTGGMLGMGAMEGGSNAQQAKNEVLGMTHEQLYKTSPDYRALYDSGVDQKVAQDDIANQVERINFAIAAPTAMVAGKLTGAAGLEGMLATGLGKFTGNMGVRGLKGAATEAVEEGMQGVSGQFAGNVGTQQYVDPNQQLTEGFGSAAASGMVVGAAMGGPMGAISKDAQGNILPGAEAPVTAPAGEMGPPVPTLEQANQAFINTQGFDTDPTQPVPPTTEQVNQAAIDAQGFDTDPLIGPVPRAPAEATGTLDKAMLEGGVDVQLPMGPPVSTTEQVNQAAIDAAPMEEPEQLLPGSDFGVEAAIREEAQGKLPHVIEAQKIVDELEIGGNLSNVPADQIDSYSSGLIDAKNGNIDPARMSPESTDYAYQTGVQEVQERIPAEQEVTPPTEKPAQAPEPVKRKAEKVITPAGTEVDTEFEVLEAGDIIDSRTKGYDQTIQPRDRDRKTSDQQIDLIANKLDPLRVGSSREAGKGSPIIGRDDNMVESGTGRTQGIKKAYRLGKAEEYKKHLVEKAGDYGIDAEAVTGMKAPVLVRRRTSDVDRTKFAAEANMREKQAMAPAEVARDDANNILKGDMINTLRVPESGDLMSRENRDFVNSYLKSLPESEQAGLVTKDGAPNKVLVDRMKSAIFVKAYDNDELLNMVSEGTGNENANLINSLLRAAPTFAEAAGKTPEFKALVSQISKGAELLARSRRNNTTIANIKDQGDLLGDMDQDAMQWAEYFENNVKSGARTLDGLRAAANIMLNEDTTTGDMFGGKAPVSIQTLIEAANAASGVGGDTRTGDMFDETTPAPEENKTDPNPSDAQIEAGNYKKKHVAWNGLDISIENEKGNTRSGTDEDGKAWEVTMQNDYGYIKGTTGNDGDHIDVFMGPNLDSNKVFVVNQTTPGPGVRKFDEHKVMVGFNSGEEALEAYKSNYEQGWSNYQSIEETTVEGFKNWLDKRSQKKPAHFTKPKKKRAPAKKKVSKEQSQAQTKFDDDMAAMGDFLGSLGAKKIVPDAQRPEFTRLLTNLMGSAFNLGYVRFKDNAKYVLDTITEKYGKDAANNFDMQSLQGSYIAMSSGKEDATPMGDVVSTTTGDLETEQKTEQPETESKKIIDAFYKDISQGDAPENLTQFRKWMNNHGMDGANTLEVKKAQEYFEAAQVRYAAEISDDLVYFEPVYNRLVDLYKEQPLLHAATSSSVSKQAFSTPAPIAYVASKLAGISKGGTVYEPTAGNGMLLIGADPDKSTVNELMDIRADNLVANGFTVTRNDATEYVPEKKHDSVIANPPFGNLGRGNEQRVDGYKIKEIDHLISAKALEAMKDTGRATLIIGANKDPGGLRTNDKIFFNWLYSHYNVADHFEVNGDLYRRQGAGWPIAVITINGRKASNKVSPKVGEILRYNSWKVIYEHSNEVVGAIQRGGLTGDETGSKDTKAPETPPTPTISGQAGGKVTKPAKQRRKPKPTTGDTGTVDTSAGLGSRTDADGKPEPSYKSDRLEKGENESQGAYPGTDDSPEPNDDPGSDKLNDIQTPYISKSDGPNEGILIPTGLDEATRKALDNLEKQVGNIDEYVMAELDYGSKAELWEHYMGLQVDGIALSIYNMKAEKGMIIADQTGVGKGRQAAAMIRWAVMNGKTPIFVSEKPNLFTDMYDDMADIGTHDIDPFLLNSGSAIVQTDKDDNKTELFKVKPKEHAKVINSGKLPADSQALFMTYSQIQTPGNKRTFVEGLAPNAIFILDESHNAGGDSNTGKFISDNIVASKGVIYLSATYAKRPDNMPLYDQTDLGDATDSKEALVDAINSGGVLMQTVISNQLAESGQLIRREKSFKGIEIKSQVVGIDDKAETKRQEDSADQFTTVLRGIVDADRQFHTGYIKWLKKQIGDGKNAHYTEGTEITSANVQSVAESVTHTSFTSVVHNKIKQMLFVGKADQAADQAIAAYKRGEKPVIALDDTLGSFLGDYVDDNGLSVGDSVKDLTFKNILQNALDRSRRLTITLPTGDKEVVEIPFQDLDPISQAAYSRTERLINDMEVEGLPVSPIDRIKNKIEEAGLSVKEITGRTQSVNYSDMTLGVVEESGAGNRRNIVDEFNRDDLNVIILNKAGATGLSLHSSETFKDQKKRHMIVAQPSLDINTFMQMLGRVNRTGQVVPPGYTLMSLNIPAEIRPTAILSKKMKSLNANTSSNTKSHTSIDAVDIINKYGDEVVEDYLHDNPLFSSQLNINYDAGDVAQQVTGKLAILPVAQQKEFYAAIEPQYKEYIEYLNKLGRNDLEKKIVDLNAKELESHVIYPGKNPKSLFGGDALVKKYEIEKQGYPPLPNEVIDEVAKSGNPQEVIADIMADKESQAVRHLAKLRTLDEKNKDDPKLKSDHVQKFNENKGNLEDDLNTFSIGQIVNLNIDGEKMKGVVTQVINRFRDKDKGNSFAYSKTAIRFAVDNAYRDFVIPLSKLTGDKSIYESKDYRSSITEVFEKAQTNSTLEERYILTGNMLEGISKVPEGKIIQFTKNDDTTEIGVLLPMDYEYSEDNLLWPVRDPKQAMNLLKSNVALTSSLKDSVVQARRDGSITIYAGKSKARAKSVIHDEELLALAATGEFSKIGNGSWSADFPKAKAMKALARFMQIFPVSVSKRLADQEGIVKEPAAVYDLSEITDPTSTSVNEINDNYKIRTVQEVMHTFNSPTDIVTSPVSAGALAKAAFGNHAQETVLAIVTNKSGKVVNVIRHSKGLKTSSVVGMGELVGAIVNTQGADSVWFAHNHPSGRLSPSKADHNMTARLNGIISKTNINMKDHVIIGPSQNKTVVVGEDSTRDLPKNIPNNKKVGVTERVIVKHETSTEQPVNSPKKALEAVKRMSVESGLMLLNNQNQPIGVIDISKDEMQSLSDQTSDQPLDRILRAFDDTNTSNVIIKTKSPSAAANIIRFINDLGGDVSVIDWFAGNRSASLDESIAGVAEKDKFQERGLWFSKRNQNTQGQTKVELDAELKKQFGARLKNIVTVSNQSELPEHLKDDAIVSGVFDPESGKIYLVAENISKAESKNLLLHEVVHGVLRSSPAYQDALTALDKVKGTPAYAEAVKAVEAANTPAEQVQEEILAYYIQNHKGIPLIKRLVGKIRAWLRSTFGMTNISIDDVYMMLEGMAKGANTAGYALNDGTIMFSRDDGTYDTFYSALGNAVAYLNMPKAPAQQWKATIAKLTQKGVKQDEINWSGVNEWLDAKGGTVTKNELVNFLRNSEIIFDEVVKENIGFAGMRQAIENEGMNVVFSPEIGSHIIVDDDGNQILEQDYYIEEDAMEAAYNLTDHDITYKDEGEDTEYANWVMKGPAKNYKELLLTIPVKMVDKTIKSRLAQVRVAKSPIYKQDEEGNNVETGEYEYYTVNGLNNWGLRAYRTAEGAQAAIDNQTDITKTVRVPKDKDREPYKSAHWGDADIAVHMRFNERDIDGKKTLFIEEIQSDWAQAGRKEGFLNSNIQKLRDKKKLLVKKMEAIDDDYGAFNKLYEQRKKLSIEIANLESDEGTVPDMPFKKTNQWSMVAMKRMIAWAGANGYEQVAWTPGQVQADRYDLAKHVDSLTFSMATYENKHNYVNVKGLKDGMRAFTQTIPMIELDGLIGKEVSQKAQEGLKNNKEFTLENQELSIGGEGMKGFYDKILPKETNKMLKKFKVKVGVSKATIDEGQQDVWSFPITEDMRTSAKKGAPLFSKKQSTREEDFLAKINPDKVSDWRETWAKFKTGLANKIRQGLVDRYDALLELDKKVYGADAVKENTNLSSWVFAKMASASEGAVHAMLDYGRIKIDENGALDMLGGDQPGIIATLGQLGSGEEIDRFMGWVAANRAERLYLEGYDGSVPKSMYEGGRENLFNWEEIQAGKKLNEGNEELYKKVYKQFNAFQNDVLRIAQKSGIISETLAEEFASQMYVPFYRVIDEKTLGTHPMGDKLSRQEFSKKLKGGEQVIGDLLENTLMNFNHLISASLRNQAATQAVTNASQPGIDIAEEVEKKYRDKNSSTFVLVDGQEVWYNINDPLVYNALVSLTELGMSKGLMKVMRGFKRVFTKFVTASPQFIAANFMRDSIQAAALGQKSMANNAVTGALRFNDKNKVKHRMIASGGAFSFGHVYGDDPDAIRESITREFRKGSILDSPNKIINAVNASLRVWDKYQGLSNRAENANRAAIYEEALKRGKSHQQAAFEARDLLDFSSRGEWAAARVLTDIVPFLNARLQGLDVMTRKGIVPTIKTVFGKGTDSDKVVANRFMVVTGAVMVASMALFLAYSDDDDFKKREEWDRDTYWWFKVGNSAFRIPKPFEVGAIGTMAERLLEQFVDDKATGELFAERMGEMMMNTFAFNPTPQMLKPLLDVYANRDSFTGRQIESMSMQNLSPAARSRANTTSMAKGVSAGLQAVMGADSEITPSPVQIDFLIKNYLGWVGATASGLVDNMVNHGERPETYWHEKQPIKRFYQQLPSAYSKYITQFYENMTEANRIYSDIRNYRQLGELGRAKELLAENKTQLKYRRSMNRASKRMNIINKRMVSIRKSESLSQSQKRRSIDILQAEKRFIAGKFKDV